MAKVDRPANFGIMQRPGQASSQLQRHQPFPVVERAPLGADRRSRGACRAAALQLEARSDQARHLRVPSLRVAAIRAKEQPRYPTPAAPETTRVIFVTKVRSDLVDRI